MGEAGRKEAGRKFPDKRTVKFPGITGSNGKENFSRSGINGSSDFQFQGVK